MCLRVLRDALVSQVEYYFSIISFTVFAESRVKVDAVVSVKCADIYIISSRFIYSKMYCVMPLKLIFVLLVLLHLVN